MCRAADNRQESTSRLTPIRAELDCDGAGAGEGARDGGAGKLLGGGSNIDINFVINILSIETGKGEGDCLSIG